MVRLLAWPKPKLFQGGTGWNDGNDDSLVMFMVYDSGALHMMSTGNHDIL